MFLVGVCGVSSVGGVLVQEYQAFCCLSICNGAVSWGGVAFSLARIGSVPISDRSGSRGYFRGRTVGVWSLWIVFFLGFFVGSIYMRTSARFLVYFRERRMYLLGPDESFESSGLGWLVRVWSGLSWSGVERGGVGVGGLEVSDK